MNASSESKLFYIGSIEHVTRFLSQEPVARTAALGSIFADGLGVAESSA